MADFHEALPEPQPPQRDPWHLPVILDAKALLRRYREPRASYRGLERIEHYEAVEIVVTTDGPFPIRALAPVLYVGDEPVDHWEIDGRNAYRFFAYERERLSEGATLALGWPDDRRPRQREGEHPRLHVEEPEE